MVLLMDEENNLVEERDAVVEDSSDDVEFVCGDPRVEPRVGDEYQVEIPPTMSASKRAMFLSTPLPLDDSSYPYLVGLPVQVMWIKKRQEGERNGDDNVDMNQSLRSLRSRRSRCSAKIRCENDKKSESKKQISNLEAVPATPSSSWEDFEVDSFVLGMYTFGKNFTRVKKFMESKGTGEIVLFYYGKFYNSAKYRCWSDSRKKRNRKCVSGRKLYSGWRQQQLLSRLMPSIPDESQKQKLVNVSKSFAEGKITLENYVSAVKDLAGLRLLVDAMAIGKEKGDLTVLAAGQVKTKPWFTVSSKPSLVPTSGAYTSLTCTDIINQLTGCSRLSKARCNDIFWEAVWPRLLARGWHSEQTEERGYCTSKDNIVFIVPGVKRFSRGKLVKGDHYFDSISDILTKVASEPELLEFETTGGEIREAAANEDSSDQSDEDPSPSGSHRKRYLKSPCSSRGTQRMKFTVVDTSLAAGGKLCDLRNLKAGSLVSEPKTHLEEKDSSVLANSRNSQNVEKSQMMPLDTKNRVEDPMRFTIIDTSLHRREKPSGFRRQRHLPGDDTKRSYVRTDPGMKERPLEKVKDPSKRSVKHKLTPRAETNYHSVNSAPVLKRRRLSACIRREESLSRETPVVKHSPGDDTVCPESDNPLSLSAAKHRNSTREEMNEEDKGRDETTFSVDFTDLKADQSKKTGTRRSSSASEVQEMSEIKPNANNNCSTEEIRTASELIASEQEQDSDKKTVQEKAVKLPSISGSNINDSPSNDPSTSQELGSSEQQQQQDGPRRQSTRKRPLTTRALEALESSFLTTKRMKSSTTTPRKRESSTKRKHSAPPKTCNRAQVDSKNAELEHRGEEDRRNHSAKNTTTSKPLDETEDSKPSLLLDEATTESKALDRIQDSKPELTQHPKLPPIVLKLSLKRG